MAPGRPVSDLATRVGGRVVVPVGSDEATFVDDVTHDSRTAGASSLFVAIRGVHHDGHAFIPAAIEAGSPAVCVDHDMGSGVVELIVDDTRAVLGQLAAEVHDNPSHALDVIGVTGTNGKTTVTHYIESIASGSGASTGLIGTIATRIGGRELGAERTTPEASDFQRLLAQMRDQGAAIVAAEVSSHALTQARVAATRFAVAAFTNLSQDHLDFHGDMDAYLSSKRSLFTDYEIGTAVINVADPAGAEIARATDADVLRVGPGGDLGFAVSARSPEGTSFSMWSPWGKADVNAPLIGDFNVSNAALAAGCSLAAGIEFADVVEGLERLPVVPGRLERVSGDDPIRVVVDYAHTPDGIRKAIETARQVCEGRVIAVVGAGGDRDREKRPHMGASASRADLTVFTSDNPRSEDPAEIIDAVVSGAVPGSSYSTEPDRGTAIEMAVSEAEDGDLVLVLGRGHEPHQEIAGERRPFDDREVARAALGRRRRKSADSGPGSGSMRQ